DRSGDAGDLASVHRALRVGRADDVDVPVPGVIVYELAPGGPVVVVATAAVRPGPYEVEQVDVPACPAARQRLAALFGGRVLRQGAEGLDRLPQVAQVVDGVFGPPEGHVLGVGGVLGGPVRVGDIAGEDVVQAGLYAGEQVYRAAACGISQDHRRFQGVGDVAVAGERIQSDPAGHWQPAQCRDLVGPAAVMVGDDQRGQSQWIALHVGHREGAFP